MVSQPPWRRNTGLDGKSMERLDSILTDFSHLFVFPFSLTNKPIVYKLFRGEGSEQDLAMAGLSKGARYGS
jgi:hypothetical protein